MADNYYDADQLLNIGAEAYRNGDYEADDFEALKYINLAETYAYVDRENNKFMWQSILKRVENLRNRIINKIG